MVCECVRRGVDERCTAGTLYAACVVCCHRKTLRARTPVLCVCVRDQESEKHPWTSSRFKLLIEERNIVLPVAPANYKLARALLLHPYSQYWQYML